MRIFFGSGLLSSITSGLALLRAARDDAPFTWRQALAWLSWGITLALAIGSVVDARRASQGKLIRDVDLETGLGERRDDELVVHAQREAERVEAGAEVRTGGRHAHGDRAGAGGLEGGGHGHARSSTEATSEVEASTTVGVTSLPSALRSAHCGSFSP